MNWRPISFVVQPLGLIVNVQSEGRPWENQSSFICFPLRIRKGGVLEPSAQVPWINVTHSVLPGLICFGLPCLSLDVTTLEALICPI